MATTAGGTEVPVNESKSRRTSKKRTAKPPRLSRLRKPEGMSLEDWQTELRRQFGREQDFRLRNVGGQPVFSEFEVANPQSKTTYRVAIRGTRPGDNFCSCPDFATNALGTCKHVEFTLAALERKRGGKAALAAGFQPDYSEVYLQYGARREARFRPGRECPVQLARLAAKFFDSEGALQPESFDRFDRFLSESEPIGHELRCYDDVLRFVAEVRDVSRRRQRVDGLFPRGIKSPAFKKLVRADLFDYQREGTLFAARAGRCLIADEMGLGKTIQAIAAAEIMAQALGVERVLIVCPTSLKHQWEREIGRFVDRQAQVISGLRPKRQQQFSEPSFYKIMNYDTVHRDLDLVNRWSPDLVILDEAQRIKNWSTRAARNVKKIASPYAIVLTGTPLENRLEELVSIVQFVDRHRLGPTYRFLHDHQVTEESGRVIGYRDLDRIGKTLAPILIRRQKKEVLSQLPGRMDKNFFVPMTQEQLDLHAENADSVANIVRKWRRFGFLSETDKQLLMIFLQNMRMSCDSTYLLDQATDFGVKADELATLLDEIFEQRDAKAVIFSQWLRMHEVLLRRFEGRGFQHVLFHGGVPGPKRKGLVDRFREEPACRTFLSTDAGGVGLNLQHASVVINMDLPWNPAVLEQRIGRVHRLGQKQPVRVVNFVAQGTIEEGMLSVLSFKKSLFAGTLDGGQKDVFLGGTRLTQFMDTVEKVTAAIPEPTDTPAAPPDETEAEAMERDSATDEYLPGTDGAAGRAGSTNGHARGKPQGEAERAQKAAAGAALDPLAGLLQTGLKYLEQLAAATQPGAAPGASKSPPSGAVALVQRDAQTGEAYLKLPMPPQEVVDGFLQAIGKLLERYRT